jgi:hypothetical protein
VEISHGFRNSSDSLAKFIAIRLASPFVSSLPADRRPGSRLWITPPSRVDTLEEWGLDLQERLDGESQYGVLAETKRPSFEFCLWKRISRIRRQRGSLLAVMNANREQFNQRL